MRYIKKTLILFLGLALAGCSYLDFDETHNLKSKEDMYEYFSTTEQMLTHIYSFMPQYLPFSQNANPNANNLSLNDAASDDAVYMHPLASIQYVNNGSWSPTMLYNDAWNLFDGIRAANSFLEEIKKVDFSRYQYDNQYKNEMKKLKFFPYEARVLRAFYFFELARRYGDIPMPLTVMTKEEANQIGKTPFDQVVNYIVQECDACIPELPLTYINEPGKQVGRVTKGFAMAVKSKALLYAASANFNPTGDVEKWKTSAKAALDIIELGEYKLTSKVAANDDDFEEVVMYRLNGEKDLYELYNFPILLTEGNRRNDLLLASNFPSQNLVDAFETVNGYAVTLTVQGFVSDDPKFDPQKPYENRDPRFYSTILTHGARIKNHTIDFSPNGLDYIEPEQGGSPTGYYIRKYVKENTSFVPDARVAAKHHWVVYRYAETLLTYAESMIEAFGDPNYTDEEYIYSASWALNQVRANAGIPDVKASSKEEFIKALRKEWRTEFAFEDHRFWDLRRWKCVGQPNMEIKGVSVKRGSDNSVIYQPKLVERRVWNNAMYLFPIPQDELYKNNNLLPQNTGWK